MTLINPTHIVDWDVTLPLSSKPVLFCDITLECAIDRSEDGANIAPSIIRMSTGMNKQTSEVENEICLPVPSDHSVKQSVIDQLKKGHIETAFDLIFAYMVSQELKKDDMLLEELA